MYTANTIKQGLRNPSLIGRELNRKYYDIKNGREYNESGIDIFEEDWDTLVILDACRYDMFEEMNILPGELSRRVSRGSNTAEFLRGNFDGKDLTNTVYTTATPKLMSKRGQIETNLHAEVNIWNSDMWDDNRGTVLPEDVTQIGLETIAEYPEKRHVIHYLQPHYPFLGSDIDAKTRGVRETEGFDIWGELMRGNLDVTNEDVWEAYLNNLKQCFEPVQDLMDKSTGKTVITSDHGNMVGERSRPVPIREWGHPSGTYTDQLVKVPWLVYEQGERREIVAESPEEFEDVEPEKVNERLRDLGYL